MSNKFKISMLFMIVTSFTAHAITYDFNFVGDDGYSVVGQFSFDENTAPAVISEDGLGLTNAIEELSVAFYDDNSNLLSDHTVVTAGVSSYFYFNLTFNTVTEQLEPGFTFDVGEDTDTNNPNEHYLFSDAGEFFTISNADTGNLDEGTNFIITPAGPQPSAVSVPSLTTGALAVLMLLLFFVTYASQKNKKSRP